MDKEEKTVKKTKTTASKGAATKKTKAASTTKKKTTTVKKKAKVEEKPILNETANVTNEKVEVVVPNPNEVECIYCHKTFEKGLTVCPHCRKRQHSDSLVILIFVIIGILIFGIICFHFAEKALGKVDNGEKYKSSCTMVDYENLVRHPKDYRNKDIMVIGEVIDVTGYDDGFGNNMEITINANQFENDSEQIILVDYYDSEYSQGFLVGDKITVYGKYTNINGNIPTIEAKYVVFGK